MATAVDMAMYLVIIAGLVDLVAVVPTMIVCAVLYQVM